MLLLLLYDGDLMLRYARHIFAAPALLTRCCYHMFRLRAFADAALRYYADIERHAAAAAAFRHAAIIFHMLMPPPRHFSRCHATLMAFRHAIPPRRQLLSLIFFSCRLS